MACDSQAIGACSEAGGNNTIAAGAASHAEGYLTQAVGPASHAEGGGAVASGLYSHAEGQSTIASGENAHTEGFATLASSASAHAEGYLSQAIGPAAHAEGGASIASGVYAHAEGWETRAIGNQSHAEGIFSQAHGIGAHAEGELTQATGLDSHAEGMETTASGQASHAEGENNIASGRASHVEGNLNEASGIFAHAEGQRTLANGDLSHAQGSQTIASGQCAHAEGAITTASGFASHTQGVNTVADSFVSHAQGQGTTTNELEGVHIMGKFGAADEASYSWYLANGTSDTEPGLAAKILSSGDVKIDGTVSSPAADYAEMFETEDGLPIEPGYFVALAGERVRIAQAEDRYVIGITSAKPAFLSDSADLRWARKFETDEWGRTRYREAEVPARSDSNGNLIVPAHMERQPILNPQWDPQQVYIPRSRRPEWVAVGLVGKLLVRDDGTCAAGGLCICNDQGIATAAEQGYYVLKRTGVNQILVLMGRKF
ncbi:autotransporter adhesin [Paenibacillus phyllosphaerae]|uniref:Autotransporter adhesin n=1 Tax=Paenibacillus phyllosphaerae TaxID=274593 RepID=A0A7W5FMH8_9BACL|nr:peptidase G2 autoproteolytic cleavage domain-containing protein [Paenibacillus phyllosphaerae]MBB3110143.1 autotransporter adhesin [Paenibacillus phyllosphaerae]